MSRHDIAGIWVAFFWVVFFWVAFFWKDASDIVAHRLELNPTSEEGLFQLAFAQALKGEQQAALATYERIEATFAQACAHCAAQRQREGGEGGACCSQRIAMVPDVVRRVRAQAEGKEL